MFYTQDKKIDYNKREYAKDLYRIQKLRPEYSNLSDNHKKVLDLHFNAIYYGIQNISFLSTYEVARKLSISDTSSKNYHQDLRKAGFLVISDILANGRRPNYGYAHQIKDMHKDYYFDNFELRTFKKKIYISRINKGGILERNCLQESQKNKELRLAGKCFQAAGVELSEEKKAKFENSQQRYNPYWEEEIIDENSSEIEEKNEEMGLMTLQNLESIDIVAGISSALPNIRITKPKVRLKKIITLDKYYKSSQSPQSCILNRLNSQLNPKNLPLERIDKHGEVLELYTKEIHNVVGAAYISPTWSEDYKNKLLLQNWSYQMKHHMISNMSWLNFSQYSTAQIMYWLDIQGLHIQKSEVKKPIYDEYFPKDYKSAFGLWSKTKNIIDRNNGEFGINLNDNYVCLDFDSEDSYHRFLALYPIIGNSLTMKTIRGYHVFFFLNKKLKKDIKERKSLFGIKIDCKVRTFVSFSKDEIYNSLMPIILPYEIYLEWMQEEPQEVENKKISLDLSKLIEYNSQEIIPIGYRRILTWKILRSVRFGLSYEDYLIFADKLYERLEQSDENYYSRREHNYNVKRAWNKSNKKDFVSYAK